MAASSPEPGLRMGLIFFSSRNDGQPDDPYRLLMESARYADTHGFSSLWIPERHFTSDGWLYPNPSVIAAALARETTRIALRAGSVVVPLHHPVRVAEEWAVVDNLSGGRVGLSFASGWHPGDFVFSPDRYADRHEDMYRGIGTIRALWRGESVVLPGGQGPVTLRTYPPPVQAELPMWVTAAGNPRTFEQAGAMGANVLTHLFNQSTEELTDKIGIFREARHEHGHAGPGQVTLMVHTFVTEDAGLDDYVRQAFADYLTSASYLLTGVAASRGQRVDLSTLSDRDARAYVDFVVDRMITQRRVLFGTPESCHHLLRELLAAGVDEIACQVDFGPSTDRVLGSLPALNRLRAWGENLAPAGPVARMAGSADRAPMAPAGNEIGTGAAEHGTVEHGIVDIVAIRARCAEEVDGVEFRRRLTEWNVELGPAFQGVRQIWRGTGEALGDVALVDVLADDTHAYAIHPALLDACLQVLIAALPWPSSRDGATMYLPVGLRRLEVYRQPGTRVFSHAVVDRHDGADGPVGDVTLLDPDGAVLAEAAGVRLRAVGGRPAQPRPAPETRPTRDDIFYEIQWQQTDWPADITPADITPAEARRWLVFADDEVAVAVRRTLTGRGIEPIMVVPDTAARPDGTGTWRIRPDSPEDMRHLVHAVTSPGSPPLAGVIHLWSLRTARPSQVDDLADAQDLGCGSVLHLVQALATTSLHGLPRLWLVTRGAQPIARAAQPVTSGAQPITGDIDVDFTQAALWGFGRALAVEHPTLWGGLVDLDPAALADRNAASLLRTIDHRDEDEVAIRQDRRYAARLVRTSVGPSGPTAIEWRPDASYLITGGLGDLGLVVARWMVEHGARHLILLGRTGLPDRASWNATPPGSRVAGHIAAVRELEARGADVVIAGVDVTDPAALAASLEAVTGAGRPPIRGVVHAAATVHGGVMLNLDRASLGDVMRPKVVGGWLLHELLADLDFFLLFSAIPATVGWLGQGSANYAAANAFLDALAAHRRAAGRPALSIGWGPWADTGLAQRTEGGLARLAGQGVGALTPAQGRDALDRLIGTDRAHIVVASVDWPAASQISPALAHSPLLRYLLAPATGPLGDGRGRPARDELLAQPADRRERWLQDYAVIRVSEILQMSADRLDPDQPLSDVGLDSLMAIDLKNRLESDLDVHVPIVTFLQGPSVRQLAAEVAAQLAGEPATPHPAAHRPTTPASAAQHPITAPPADPDAASIRAAIDQLSDDEVALALARLDGLRDPTQPG